MALTLSQPALVGDRARSDFLRSTHRYLPGAVVRGAFAAAWIARYGPVPSTGARRAEFLRLFEGGVRFAPLFHSGAFVPLSVKGHKYGPESDCRVAEIDLAANPAARTTCGECDAYLEARPGLPDPVATHRRVSVQIGPDGVAVRGNLFSRDTLNTGQQFTGHLVAGPEPLELLTDLGTVRIGGRRTTHGQAQVSIDASRGPDPLQQRPDGRIILRLRGPAVFVDNHGRPTDRPNQDELDRELGTRVDIEDVWVRWDHHGGWHAASGLPKPGELAAAAGSTYVLRPHAPVSPDTLAALAARGLGLRRHEGFGDLAGTYTPRPSPWQTAQDNARLAATHAGVRGLSTHPGWHLIRDLLGAAAGGDSGARQRLTALARRIEDPPPTDQRPEQHRIHAARALLRLLDQPGPVIRAVLDVWGPQ